MCAHTRARTETRGCAAPPAARAEPEPGKAAGRHPNVHPSTRAEAQGMSSGVGLTHSRGGVRFKVHKHIVGEEGRDFLFIPNVKQIM